MPSHHIIMRLVYTQVLFELSEILDEAMDVYDMCPTCFILIRYIWAEGRVLYSVSIFDYLRFGVVV